MNRQKLLFLFAGLLLPVGAAVVWLTSPRGTLPSPTSQAATVEPAFNVPSLVGQSISQLRTMLGTPSEFTSPDSVQHPPDLKEWDTTWKKNGVELLVTYDLQSGKVIDFFIPTDDPSGKTSDLEHLKALAGVQDGASNYSLEGVVAMNPQGTRDTFTGLKITPKS